MTTRLCRPRTQTSKAESSVAGCQWIIIYNNNNNNNNIVICKAHKVSSNAELEAPAVARWAALVGYAKRTVLRWHLKVSAVGESLVSRGKSFQTVGAR